MNGDESGSENESGEESDKVEIDYTYADRFEHVPANAVLGGYQSRGDFKYEFFLEHYPVPLREEYTVSPNGRTENTNHELSSDVERKVQFAIQCTQNESIQMGLHLLSRGLGVEKDRIWSVVEDEVLPDREDRL